MYILARVSAAMELQHAYYNSDVCEEDMYARRQCSSIFPSFQVIVDYSIFILFARPKVRAEKIHIDIQFILLQQ